MPASVAQTPGRVSGLVVLSALFLLLIGVLTVLVGTALVLGGGILGQLGSADTDTGIFAGTGLFGALGGIVAGVGVVMIVWALLEILGGFGMLFRRAWGRAIGFFVGLIGAVFTGLVFVGAIRALSDTTDSGSAAVGIAIALVVFLGYLLTVVALARGGAHFRRG